VVAIIIVPARAQRRIAFSAIDTKRSAG
jgi:hypothetical protein